MFVSVKKMSVRAADVADLMIEFATLGEYGLEPVEIAVENPDRRSRRRPCEARRREGPTPRHQRVRRAPDDRADVRRKKRDHADTPSEAGARPDTSTSSLPEALRPPRIELSWQTAV